MDVTDHGDNTSTWHWKTTYTLPTYLASVSTGKYALVQDQYQGINGTVPVTFYCRPGDTAKVPGTFVNLHSILSIFENRFGPYPFERVGFTATAQGAMEHASNISYPYSGWNGNTSNDWWYGHELSHMWFGDAVTCASAEDMWLNEGWARWCETVITEGLYGQQAAKDDNRAKLKEVLQHTHVTDGGYYALYGIPQTLTYGSTVYDKGGQVTHTLRHYLGDSLFFGGVKACLQQYACQPASSFDLRDFLSTYSGTDLAAFFDAWVFTPGFPHFSVDSMRVTPEGNAFKTIVFVRQKAKGTTHLADENHLGITFLSKDWQFYIDTLHFSGRNGSKTFSLPFEPVAAMADLDEQISDATTDYAMTVKSTGEVEFPQTLSRLITTQVADSAFVRITHNWVAPDSLRAPVPGLRLSDYRYWTVEGLFTPGFRAKAKFSYSRSNNLDNNLLTDSKDSLVILYRPGAGHEWRGVKFTKQGSWFLGTLTVDSLATGDYTLAVWDDLYAGTGEFIPAGKKAMQIYPNPAPGKCTIETETVQKAFLRVYDTAGKLLDTIRIGKGKNFTGWSAPPNAGSVLVFRLAGADGEELSTTKVVFKN
jgi:aminopeptidase N